MKKVTIIVMLSVMFLVPSLVFGGENYFQFRQAFGEKDFYENYIILENNSMTDWAIGTKIISLPDGLTILNPHIFWKKFESFQIGIKYCRTSLSGDSVGPAFRFIKKTDLVFLFLDSAYYFDTHGGDNKIDTWLHVSNPEDGLYFGAEIWHYNSRKGPGCFHLRPFKIGYRSRIYPSPFLMIERKWIEWKDSADKIYVGLEMVF